MLGRISKAFRSKAAGPTARTEAPSAVLDRARAHKERGQLTEAAALCEQILASEPDRIDAVLLLAELDVARSDRERALALYTRAIELKPDMALPYYKRGNLLKDRGQLESALADYDQAIAFDAHYAYALCNRGVVLASLERFQAALASYDRALTVAPDDVLTLFNRGAALRALGRRADALASYDRALALNPDYIECHCNRALLLVDLGRTEEALTAYGRAIERGPGFAEAHFGRGNLLRSLNRPREALTDLARTVEIDSARGDAWLIHGLLLAQLGRSEQSLASFDRATALRPDDPIAFSHRGTMLLQLKRHGAAIASFDQAIACDPHVRLARGLRVFARMSICSWSGLDAERDRIAADLRADRAAAPPFTILPLLEDPSLHRRVAGICTREDCPPNEELGAIAKRCTSDRLRVGYFSCDLHDHPVAQLMAGVFEMHDRSRFEVTAFSYGPPARDAVRKRLEGAFDRFIDVREQSDRAIASLARSHEIDIAVDLNGFTGDCRPGIFARRAAPLQVNYLGYPATMSADYMDYLIGDRTIIPPQHRLHYSEKVVYLPHCYMPSDATRTIDEAPGDRAQHRLPASGFVFCCFNSSYKITPAVFDAWTRILARVPGSVLWLSQGDAAVTQNLREEAIRRGTDPERLVFAEREPSLSAHLARQRLAGLFLDTFPFNAHTTANNALWAGLPVLTLLGQAFCGRVAASLLTAVGIPELITTTVEEYEELAVHLATDAQALSQVSGKLEDNRLKMPLFDTPRFTRNLESAYTRMFGRYQAGLPPEHMDIASP
ncbi:MAG TPA: tetratricopeptide repeat protein [Steroidobacteraceae bacterium]|nr:tetratricopeptide repeat protein [Steroidobacteraceae bacterium]